jgi:hypothetical protein
LRRTSTKDTAACRRRRNQSVGIRALLIADVSASPGDADQKAEAERQADGRQRPLLDRRSNVSSSEEAAL